MHDDGGDDDRDRPRDAPGQHAATTCDDSFETQRRAAVGSDDENALTDQAQADAPDALLEPRTRGFICTDCGFETEHEVAVLQSRVGATCVNCGDWTIQTASTSELVDAAKAVASVLEGGILTERQATAYLLRDVIGVDRSDAATVMDSSPSNVDNLQRRAAEKLADARRILAGIDAATHTPGSPEG